MQRRSFISKVASVLAIGLATLGIKSEALARSKYLMPLPSFKMEDYLLSLLDNGRFILTGKAVKGIFPPFDTANIKIESVNMSGGSSTPEVRIMLTVYYPDNNRYSQVPLDLEFCKALAYALRYNGVVPDESESEAENAARGIS
jgi:hypothetical protein